MDVVIHRSTQAFVGFGGLFQLVLRMQTLARTQQVDPP